MTKAATKPDPMRHRRTRGNAALSRFLCPSCGSELDARVETYSCIGAIDGPYIRGNVRLTCHAGCPYMYSLTFTGSSAETFAVYEEMVANIIAEAPRLVDGDIKIREGLVKRKGVARSGARPVIKP